MGVLWLPLTGGFIAHSHNEGINGNIPGTGVLTHNGVRVLSPGPLGGLRSALGLTVLSHGPEGLS